MILENDHTGEALRLANERDLLRYLYFDTPRMGPSIDSHLVKVF